MAIVPGSATDQVHKVLQRGPASCTQLAEETGLSAGRVYAAMKLLRKHTPRLARIQSYGINKHGRTVPVYALGDAPDAKRPPVVVPNAASAMSYCVRKTWGATVQAVAKTHAKRQESLRLQHQGRLEVLHARLEKIKEDIHDEKARYVVETQRLIDAAAKAKQQLLLPSVIRQEQGVTPLPGSLLSIAYQISAAR